MIDAKSLRIGNWVKHGEVPSASEYPGTLFQWSIDHCYDIATVKLHYASLEPIPLTPEILEKCGFKFQKSIFCNIALDYYVHDAVCLFFNESDKNIFLSGYGFTDFDGKYYAATFRWITSVHTLQNIFHALTNTELNVEWSVATEDK